MSLTELLPSIRQLPAFEKVRLIRILAEELETTEDISFGVGQELMAALAEGAEA